METGVDPCLRRLGPLLFTAYSSNLFTIINNLHCTTLRLTRWYWSGAGYWSHWRDAPKKLEHRRMLTDKLRLNDNKTEFLTTGTKQQLSKISPYYLTIAIANVSPVNSARNMETWMDTSLTLQDQSCLLSHTAISRKVVGKSAHDNPERHCGWF